ncbi:MAG: hypothetical protein RLZZ141_173 [Pseudomonadota bacterium]
MRRPMSQSARSNWIIMACFSVSLAGCAGAFTPKSWVQIQPIVTKSEADPAQQHDDYNAVLRAIDLGDYATALSLLQVARAKRPDDVRIINAFGVVYDKLGRFDLSARYYAQALEMDGQSAIVANNLRYSAILQQNSQAIYAAMVESRPTPRQPEPPLGAVQVPPPQLAKIDMPAGQGKGMTIIDRSGPTGRPEAIRQTLATLGWSVPKRLAEPETTAARTTIVHPHRRRIIAKVLALTLPGRTALIDCGTDCSVIALTLGQDTADWPNWFHQRPHNAIGRS